MPTFAGDIAFNVAAVEDAPKDPNVRWGASNAFFRSYARTRDVDDLMTAYIHCLNSLRAGQTYRDGTFEDDPDQPLNVRMGRLEALINDTPRRPASPIRPCSSPSTTGTRRPSPRSAAWRCSPR